MNVLVVDVGGTHVKILATGQEQSRKFPSGPELTPRQMYRKLRTGEGRAGKSLLPGAAAGSKW